MHPIITLAKEMLDDRSKGLLLDIRYTTTKEELAVLLRIAPEQYHNQLKEMYNETPRGRDLQRYIRSTKRTLKITSHLTYQRSFDHTAH